MCCMSYKLEGHTSPGACQPKRHIPSNITSYCVVCDWDATVYLVILTIYRWTLFMLGYENHRISENKQKSTLKNMILFAFFHL